MKNKKLLTMQDLSCVGQCSLTVALPILSANGIETCVLPTAILSNHTMFKSWSYLDLTDEIENIFSHWKNNDFKFDAFLLGYLGKPELIKIAEICFYTNYRRRKETYEKLRYSYAYYKPAFPLRNRHIRKRSGEICRLA